MILGIGTDIVKLARFYKLIERNGGIKSHFMTKFAQRVLDLKYEFPQFEQSQRENDIVQGVRILGDSWCVKESIFKSLDHEDQCEFSMKDWYKYNNHEGKPFIGGKYLEHHLDEQFLVSISHDTDVLVSTVIRQQIIQKQKELQELQEE